MSVELLSPPEAQAGPLRTSTEVYEPLRTLVIQTEHEAVIADFILPNGENVGPYSQWLTDWSGLAPNELEVTNVADGERLPRDPSVYDLIIGTGSGRNTSERLRWMWEVQDFKRAADKSGVLQYDICLMHQLRSEAQGGATEDLPEFRFGIGEVTKTKAGKVHPLYEGLPDTFLVFQSNGRVVSEPGTVDGLPAIQLARSRRNDGVFKNEALLTGAYGMSAQHHAEGTPAIWEALTLKKVRGGSLLVPSESGELVKPSQEQVDEIVHRVRTVGQTAETHGKIIGHNLRQMAIDRRVGRRQGF